MICTSCKSELKPAIVHKLVGLKMSSQPDFECPACFAIYDSDGMQLEPPLRTPPPKQESKS